MFRALEQTEGRHKTLQVGACNPPKVKEKCKKNTWIQEDFGHRMAYIY